MISNIKISVKQRHKEYVEMREVFIKYVEAGISEMGFCTVISSKAKLNKIPDMTNEEIIAVRYPELYSHKPTHNEDWRYWFDRYDTKRRLDVLDSVIEETFNKMKWMDRVIEKIRLKLRLHF